jgi:hypothetical protein
MTPYTITFTDGTTYSVAADFKSVAELRALQRHPGKTIKCCQARVEAPTPPRVGIGNDLLTTSKTMPTSGQFVVVWTFNLCAWCGTYRFDEYGDLTRYEESVDTFVTEEIALTRQPWFRNDRATFFVYTS